MDRCRYRHHHQWGIHLHVTSVFPTPTPTPLSARSNSMTTPQGSTPSAPVVTVVEVDELADEFGANAYR